MNKKTPKIACFGEVLWDFLPSGKVVGGAPMNVAYHANQLGIPTQMISKIGRDLLGENIIDFLNNKRIFRKLTKITYYEKHIFCHLFTNILLQLCKNHHTT